MLQGVYAPVLTPFRDDLSADAERLAAHCRWLVSQNCGLVLFGTTSEANSLSVAERRDLLDAVLAAGLDPAGIIVGTGCCALTDTVDLTRHAVERGCGGALMLPPFYYKAVGDEGLFGAFAEAIERVGNSRLKVYLYHIPQVSGVGLSVPLVERLVAAYPGTVVGLKDSSGDWSNSRALLEAIPGFGLFVGSEALLLPNMRAGGVGCISATCNVNPGPIRALYDRWRDADERQEAVNKVREAFQRHPMIPGLKATLARATGDDGWRTVRPPFLPLPADSDDALAAELDRLGFSMPGL